MTSSPYPYTLKHHTHKPFINAAAPHLYLFQISPFCGAPQKINRGTKACGNDKVKQGRIILRRVYQKKKQWDDVLFPSPPFPLAPSLFTSIFLICFTDTFIRRWGGMIQEGSIL